MGLARFSSDSDLLISRYQEKDYTAHAFHEVIKDISAGYGFQLAFVEFPAIECSSIRRKVVRGELYSLRRGQPDRVLSGVGLNGMPEFGSKVSHKRIRRVSIDKFYEIVTGQHDAFEQICFALPEVVSDVLKDTETVSMPQDTVYEELLERAKKFANVDSDMDTAMMLSMYMLGFSTYNGFKERFGFALES